MAINPNVTLAPNVTAPDTDYPYGSSKNETTPGAKDGTPYNRTRANDVFGMQQALLKTAKITPSGSADTATESQYVQAIAELAAGRAYNYDDSGAADAYVLSARANQQAPASYFDGMVVKFTAENDNTGSASTVNLAGLGVKDIKLQNGADPAAGMISGKTELVFDSSNDRFTLKYGENARLVSDFSDISGFGGGIEIYWNASTTGAPTTDEGRGFILQSGTTQTVKSFTGGSEYTGTFESGVINSAGWVASSSIVITNASGSYIKHASGWASQVTTDVGFSFEASDYATAVITMPLEMSSTDYVVSPMPLGGDADYTGSYLISADSTTQFTVIYRAPVTSTTVRQVRFSIQGMY